VVISRAVNEGQTVAASLQAPVIFTIAQDLRKMEVHTNVAESDIGRLQKEMRVTFTVDAYPGEPFRGKIRDIRNAPQIVQNVVTYDAVIDVANEELKLKPGMTATVSVVTDRREDAISVPNAALRFRPEGMDKGTGNGNWQAGGAERRQGGGAGAGNRQRRERGADGEEGRQAQVARRTVWVEVNGKPEPREVTTGISDGRVTEITSGDLKEGENVIVSLAGANPNQQRGQGQQRGGFRIL
jgi:HlyD family secretion protein